jgi:hypothetical protein
MSDAKGRPDTKGWIVTTSPDRPVSEIVRDLHDAGFAIGRVLDEVGSITSAADDDAIQKVGAVKGVVDVSPDTPVDIGPPASSEGW